MQKKSALTSILLKIKFKNHYGLSLADPKELAFSLLLSFYLQFSFKYLIIAEIMDLGKQISSTQDFEQWERDFQQYQYEYYQSEQLEQPEQQQPEIPSIPQTPLLDLLNEIPNETFELYPMNEANIADKLESFQTFTFKDWAMDNEEATNFEASSSTRKRPNEEQMPESQPTKKAKVNDLRPFCSCTGTPRKCVKKGNGVWESTCCTATISEYPLPINPKPFYKRYTGRQMNAKRIQIITDKLQSDGVDLSKGIDLKDFWKHPGYSPLLFPD